MNNESAYRVAVLVLLVLMWLVRLPVRRYASWRENWSLLWRDPLDAIYLLGWSVVGLVVLVAYFAFPAAIGWAAVPLPAALRWSAVACSIAALALLRWADAALGENLSVAPQLKPNHQLITTGPYRWIRHPIYLAALLYFAGLAILAANVLVAICSFGGMAILVATRVAKEDRRLEERFGDQYRQWAARTGRLLPRFRR